MQAPSKTVHEIRDAVHVFVRLDSDERRVLNSRSFQRLRHIHQLALSYLVYPGATHKRFEHSLGVMELAGRVFDVVCQVSNVSDKIRRLLPEINEPQKLIYWRRVLRMAALCHDIGHLPFSHAAEKELLPPGWTHEDLTREIIESAEMRNIWEEMTPPLRVGDITKLAIGPKKAKDRLFDNWQAILSEIIVGDAFGVDRMDYLLRDSHHAGVSYGRFDHYRLIDTLRILPKSDEDDSEPALGVEAGGLHSAEALSLARYFMYSQLYFHPVRRIYDIHLQDFLQQWLPSGKFSTALADHLALTDNEVTAALLAAARNASDPNHLAARRLIMREHFRLVYARNPEDIKVNSEASEAVYKAMCEKFGADSVRYDRFVQKNVAMDFPVQSTDGRIVSSVSLSETLAKLPIVNVECVFVAPESRVEAEKWLQKERSQIIKMHEGEGQ